MSADWSSAAFRNALVALVRRRVPERDAEDVVQATLTEVISSATRPSEPEALRKWIWGIARNKVADYHRKARREVFDLPDIPGPARGEQAERANDLLRWATRELPPGRDAAETFAWLLREGEGEKLEAIAGGEQVPPARVRQRVSRLRRHFRARWAAQVAALAALGVVGIVALIWALRRHTPEPPPIAHEPEPAPAPSGTAPSPLELARAERDEAFALCDRKSWRACLDKLDRAAGIAPEINAEPDVIRARTTAASALQAAPPVAPSASSAPRAKPRSTPPGPTSAPVQQAPQRNFGGSGGSL